MMTFTVHMHTRCECVLQTIHVCLYMKYLTYENMNIIFETGGQAHHRCLQHFAATIVFCPYAYKNIPSTLIAPPDGIFKDFYIDCVYAAVAAMMYSDDNNTLG